MTISPSGPKISATTMGDSFDPDGACGCDVGGRVEDLPPRQPRPAGAGCTGRRPRRRVIRRRGAASDGAGDAAYPRTVAGVIPSREHSCCRWRRARPSRPGSAWLGGRHRRGDRHQGPRLLGVRGLGRPHRARPSSAVWRCCSACPAAGPRWPRGERPASASSWPCCARPSAWPSTARPASTTARPPASARRPPPERPTPPRTVIRARRIVSGPRSGAEDLGQLEGRHLLELGVGARLRACGRGASAGGGPSGGTDRSAPARRRPRPPARGAAASSSGPSSRSSGCRRRACAAARLLVGLRPRPTPATGGPRASRRR